MQYKCGGSTPLTFLIPHEFDDAKFSFEQEGKVTEICVRRMSDGTYEFHRTVKKKKGWFGRLLSSDVLKM